MPIDLDTTARGMSPSLAQQTPGLDTARPIRDLVIRETSWFRENKGLALSVLGGIAAMGLGTWLVLRRREPTRMELAREKGAELFEWLRAKLS